MKITELTLLGILIIILLVIIIVGDIKKRAYNKGYNDGVKQVTHNMLSTATWFGSNDKKIYNCLYLFATDFRKYGSISSDRFRDEMQSIDHNKRIIDLPKP